MTSDLLAALCLVLVLEGLFLFAAPAAWKRTMAQLIETPPRTLRLAGGAMIGAGLVALYFVRS